ncbi:MAG: sulfite exporter TauE/SafE family protein [Acidobacteriia bacterium]|nr:sulfite exporter TauE/SafE family protein [Terriglobia bacterium]
MILALLLFQDQSKLEHLLITGAGSPLVLTSALGLAFFLGAAHALTPGHGKTIVAAYLVGSRGRIGDAVYLGSVVTLTHTASVFILGLATLYASQHISLDRIYPVLSLLSGAMVMGIGLWLLWQRRHGGHGHDHHHHDHHHHDHNHDHHHDHHHDHDHDHDHHHKEGKASLLSLGISGGLVPCPEALVVLMLSISLRQVALGLTLLVAFSLGLAAILIGIGCAMVLAGPAVERWKPDAAWTRSLPLVSAAVVTVLGAVMVIQALR